MPIYEYRCEKGHTFDVMQRIADDPVATCQTCERPVARVMHPVAVHFKGKGFYNTDYGTRKRQREKAAGGEEGSGSSSSGSEAKSSEGKSSDSTPSDGRSPDSGKPASGGKKPEAKPAKPANVTSS